MRGGKQAFTAFTKQCCQLSSQLNPVKSSAALAPGATSAFPQQVPQPRVGETKRYDGELDPCNAFITSCSRQLHTFATEAAKVTFFSTHLKG